jgi:hypothetical protein
VRTRFVQISGISDLQLNLQTRAANARTSAHAAGFHPNMCLQALFFELAIELLGFFAMD